MNFDNRVLVGDVGGTHARFAVVELFDGSPWRILHRVDLVEPFASFNEALRSYLDRAGLTPLPRLAAIAVAGPIVAGTARFTNRGWEISERALREVGFESAILINDFAALALAVVLLDETHLRSVGPQIKGLAGGAVTILGAGTGFGVSCLARYGDLAVPMATEGGHISFAPGNSEELAVLRLLWRESEHVSVERILSGDGLELLYRTLQKLAGRAPEKLSAVQISAAAFHKEEGACAALTMFCSIFGAVAGDLALAHGARGGVYIAGGIAEKIAEFLILSPFRRRFEDKGRLKGYLAEIPTQLIVYPDIALLGAARSAILLARAAAG